jgi:hypothetical protein
MAQRVGAIRPYTWTANPILSTLQSARFYVPAAGAISLLGSWLVTRLPRRASLAAVTSAAAVMMFGLGAWSFTVIREFWLFPPVVTFCVPLDAPGETAVDRSRPRSACWPSRLTRWARHRALLGPLTYQVPGHSVQPFVRALEHFTIWPSPGSQAGEPSGEEPPGVCGSLDGHLPWETALREPSRLVQTGSGPTSHRGGHWFDPSIAHQVRGYVGLYQRSRWEPFL